MSTDFQTEAPIASAKPAHKMGQILSTLIKKGQLTNKHVEYGLRVLSKMPSPQPLLNVLKDLKYVSNDLIWKAICEDHAAMSIGDLLLELGYVSESNLKNALNIFNFEPSEIYTKQKCIFRGKLSMGYYSFRGCYWPPVL